ncbi:MAG: DNA helicase RecQ [Clostridiales Family XIII bacterium]|jgi:ATP-dependent DNA helicase RecQ|nr:DNA helicase RecQ [Clostridiales Family XIII bacterium]
MKPTRINVNTPGGVLRQYFGYERFRDGQEAIIEALLSGRDAMGIMPTGAGKSICYQVPALLLEGQALVISPLISLMKDQVQALAAAGVPATCIHSAMTADEYAEAMHGTACGEYKILYVAPERLDAPDFERLMQTIQISMVTVDEAHCVSQWGQDFRPSYLKIAEFISSLPERPVVAAFTATATENVREDIIRHIELDAPYVCVTGFDRKNLYFEVRRPADKLRDLLAIIEKRKEKCGIVYCATRRAVEEVCEALGRKGYSATRYHAGLSDAERRANQDDFSYDRKQIMVATNAFGMGIDKSNVGYVIHYNMPKNLESYYQEAGRAGRDGNPADCILLYGAKDVHLNKFLIEKSAEQSESATEEERRALIAKDMELLKVMTFYAATTDCLRSYILKYFGEKADLFCGNCHNCHTIFEEIDVTEDAQKIISCVYRITERAWPHGKTMIADVLRGSANEKLRRAGFDELSTYGIMTDVPKRRIVDLIDHLSKEGYLLTSDGQYPTITLSAKSGEITKGGKQIILKMPKYAEPLPPSAAHESAKSNDSNEPVSAELFDALRVVRRRLADEAKVPAYVIFADAALKDMCRKMPATESEFLDVSGVGEHKLAKYGAVFLETIQTYAATQNQEIISPTRS